MPEGAVRALWWLVALSLVPAALLGWQRHRAEGDTRRVAIVMDEDALETQARTLNRDPFELALHYRSLGLPGIAIYEQTPRSLAADGRAAMITGADAIAQTVANGLPPPDVPAHATLIRALEPGALDDLIAAMPAPPDTVRLGGHDWWALPGDDAEIRPAGPDRTKVARYVEAGFDVAYRPRNAPGLRDVGATFPGRARYLIHAGLDVAGHPHDLTGLADASQAYWTAVIEGTPQDGFAALRGKVPTVRLLSFNQDYLNQGLRPAEVVDKYLLAAEERNVRLLYLRPYTEQQLGDMLANTEALVGGLVAALEASGFEIGPLPLDQESLGDYAPSRWLRAAAAVGVLAGLGLLAALYPGVWGLLAAAAVGGLGVVAAGLDWDALALIAALVFPVLGYGRPLREGSFRTGTDRTGTDEPDRRGAWILLRATAVSLIGAILLVAVGSDRASVLGVEPFRGVAATLVVPPALFLAHAMLRERGPAGWLRTLWSREIRLGPAMLAAVGVAALALVVIRRGNTPIIGASELELEIREALASAFARPRFKELLGHPLGLLGLTGKGWPEWIRAPLLTGGVIAQASILNSFAHYHTPLAISLERTIVALALGGALGLAGVIIARPLVRWGRRWLDAAA
ncbi:MAG: DUF5693 family protein [Trueperaceae bacterium]|nr:DUF5693 family protein [Trueperaceae bacterium]